MQEEATGRKRVEKLDWMYATPSAQDGASALGGTRMDEKAMEDYLLGKRRVDDVLKAGEKNVSAKGGKTQRNPDSFMSLADRRSKQGLYRRSECQQCHGYRRQDP